MGTWAYWINYSWHFSLKKAVYHSVTWTLLALLKPLFSSVCVCVYLWPIVIITNFNLNHKRISSKSCYRLSYSDWHLFGSVDYCCSSVNNFDKSPFKKKKKISNSLKGRRWWELFFFLLCTVVYFFSIPTFSCLSKKMGWQRDCGENYKIDVLQCSSICKTNGQFNYQLTCWSNHAYEIMKINY